MESNRRIGLIGIAIIICAIAISIPTMAEARTIQIVNLLLQNLHDVFIINPQSGQILTYNGTYWINANATGGNNTSGVTSLTSSNDAITLNATSGNILITPKYELLCQDNATSGDTDLTCSSFTARRILFITIESESQTASNTWGIRFNGNSGSNYANRASLNNGADSTNNSVGQCSIPWNLNTGEIQLTEAWIYNYASSDEKGITGHVIRNIESSPSQPPNRYDFACSWSITSAQITTISFLRLSGTGTLASGTLTVWGYD